MTWSIIAREPSSGRLGIAISTRALAVGAICPWIRSGVGAISTQSYSNPLYGPGALDLMATGQPVRNAIEAMIATDEGHAWRQVHGVDAKGRTFAYSGSSCVDWFGQVMGDQVSVAGNMLAGAEVISETLKCYQSRADLEFSDRLLTALEAGETTGGDKRGKQSAALLVHSTEAYADVDLRVDDNAEPISELRRIFGVYCRERQPYMETMPSSRDPAGIYNPEEREAVIAEKLKNRA